MESCTSVGVMTECIYLLFVSLCLKFCIHIKPPRQVCISMSVNEFTLASDCHLLGENGINFQTLDLFGCHGICASTIQNAESDTAVPKSLGTL